MLGLEDTPQQRSPTLRGLPETATIPYNEWTARGCNTSHTEWTPGLTCQRLAAPSHSHKTLATLVHQSGLPAMGIQQRTENWSNSMIQVARDTVESCPQKFVYVGSNGSWRDGGATVDGDRIG
eukprot:1141513-Pelagomonas_calceolata.AAC.3